MRVYNTMSRSKEEFAPVSPGRVGVYACGPTVYDYFHIGNARAFLTFDLLRRHLIRRGYRVDYAQNFTDIDDRMIRRAQDEGTTVAELGDRFIRAYFEDADALGIRRADAHPRATEHIGEIVGLIRRLVDRGAAYPSGGDVYFDTVRYRDRYGKLSGQNLSELEAGARVEAGEAKRDPMDFALWKGEKPGEPAWDSPWGRGRPGWHIECSAMSMARFGETIDIHCGGGDLIFPHHENEIAQSEAATGKPFAKYWMHNGMINVEGAKMSKSEGNFFTVREILAEYEPEAIRLFLLSAHYRSPANFSRAMMAQAAASLNRLYTARDNAAFALAHAPKRALTGGERAFTERAKSAVEKYDAAMDDDLNTADALGAIFEHVRDLNALASESPCAEALSAGLGALTETCGALGLLEGRGGAIPEEVERLVAARAEAKRNKDYAQADRLRAEAVRLGYVIEDTPLGPKARRK